MDKRKMEPGICKVSGKVSLYFYTINLTPWLIISIKELCVLSIKHKCSLNMGRIELGNIGELAILNIVLPIYVGYTVKVCSLLCCVIL